MADLQRWKIGDVRVTKLVELEWTSSPTWILPDATPERLARETWLQPHFADGQGKARMSVHAFVIESLGQRIVVDTCIGNDKVRRIPAWDRLHGTFLQDLEAAGFAADSIDTVLCTHLHVDHVGWNTRLENGRWAPTFPSARYLFARREYEYWTKHDTQEFGDVMGDSVRPVVEAGLVDLVDVVDSVDAAGTAASGHAVNAEIGLEPTPGHTPGHVSVRIRSRGEEAMITGDLMHHPVQCAHPEWASSADVDAEQAQRTRRDFLARCAATPVLVLGTHFASPTAGRIVRDGDTWRFDA